MPITVFWMRRDLRLNDNAGLYHALKSGNAVQIVFIFDRHILDNLTDKTDARVTFIHRALHDVQRALEPYHATLDVYYGYPLDVWPRILATYRPQKVVTNRDYEPYALERDRAVQDLCAQHGVAFETYKDHVIFEKDEVLKDDGTPYTVFTPYSRKWRQKLTQRKATDGSGLSYYLQSYPTTQYLSRCYTQQVIDIPTLESMGFTATTLELPGATVSQGLIRAYGEQRNYPAVVGTSRLGIHFRFGTISIREKAAKAQTLSDTFFNELIWRDFYSQILAHFPHVATSAFRPEYNQIEWRQAPDEFAAWCEGRTGYPLVDAGMRELNATGYMHNRVRMVTASFLTKHLLIDWRLGEAYFAQKLLDFDLASNNGGWQWAAGCGTDAAPYFRIFNPDAQAQKFDKEAYYIKKWVPEYGTPAYPQPIVEHGFARQRCLDTYKKSLKGG